VAVATPLAPHPLALAVGVAVEDASTFALRVAHLLVVLATSFV